MQVCRSDCTCKEVAAAVLEKIRMVGKQITTGLPIIAVPKMFEGPHGFHRRFWRHASEEAAEQERQRLN